MATTQRRDPLAARADQDVALASESKQTERLYPDQIRTDGGTQMRAGLNESTVVEYVEAITGPNAWPFPPVAVYHDGSTHWLADGFHRVEAARRYAEREQVKLSIPAEVSAGTRRDAILAAAKANADHGLRRTNADKRRAVEVLLNDEEWRAWSDREIARRCKVSNNFVSELRRSLSSDDSENDDDPSTKRTYTTRHGTQATMNVAGQRQAAQERKVEATDSQPPAIMLPDDLVQTGRCSIKQVADGYIATAVDALTRYPRKRKFDSLERSIEFLYVASGLRKPAPIATTDQPRALTTDETVVAIFKALNKHERRPGQRYNWLVQHSDMADYAPTLNPGFVLVESAFEAAYQRALLEVAEEQPDPAQVAAVVATMHIPDGPEAPALPDDLVALGCRLELDAGFYHVRYGSHRSEYASFDGAVAWCRRITGTDGNDQAGTQGTRQERIAGLLALYQQVLASLPDYGQLTGDFTGALPLRRALEPMISRLEANVTKGAA